jgi:hypothetical protein
MVPNHGIPLKTIRSALLRAKRILLRMGPVRSGGGTLTEMCPPSRVSSAQAAQSVAKGLLQKARRCLQLVAQIAVNLRLNDRRYRTDSDRVQTHGPFTSGGRLRSSFSFADPACCPFPQPCILGISDRVHGGLRARGDGENSTRARHEFLRCRAAALRAAGQTAAQARRRVGRPLLRPVSVTFWETEAAQGCRPQDNVSR